MNFLRMDRRMKEFGIKEFKKDERMENWKVDKSEVEGSWVGGLRNRNEECMHLEFCIPLFGLWFLKEVR